MDLAVDWKTADRRVSYQQMMSEQTALNTDGRPGASVRGSVTRRSFIGLAIGTALAIGLAACGDEEPAPQVQQVAQPQATNTPTTAAPTAVATEPPATATPAPTNTPQPAATPEATQPPATPTATTAATQPPATATPVPEPTATPTAAPEPTATPAPEPTAATVELPPVEPYDPQDEQSIYDRYAADAARIDAVLASGYPILLVSDAIW
ncbi:MAG: hypothetical protein OXG46_14385 [Chloroflexi bacterium]|nr:hypothetical protein [Chloroflexota bacterium]MCY3939072.1 hypothetical protein [Chloroflexota bacterium]